MLTNIIRKWGFENSRTITFATIIEDNHFSNKAIEELYKTLMDL